jgi:hypothetical protein
LIEQVRRSFGAEKFNVSPNSSDSGIALPDDRFATGMANFFILRPDAGFSWHAGFFCGMPVFRSKNSQNKILYKLR